MKIPIDSPQMTVIYCTPYSMICASSVCIVKKMREPNSPNRQKTAKPISDSRILLFAALSAWS